MKIKLRIIPLICFTVLAIGIVVYSYKNSSPHKFNFMEGECGSCHISYEYPVKFKDNITALCNKCHEKDNAMSHIVGVKPSMYLGDDFPLDERGEMTCNTCHDIHSETIDPLTKKRTYLLRSKLRGKDLCDDCHLETMNVLMPGAVPRHSEITSDAHFGYYTTKGGQIDAVSEKCISCHSGDIAEAIHYTLNGEKSMGGSHPIGGNYRISYARSRDLKYPDDIDSRIKFFEGKMGCVSCHDIFNLKKMKLVVSNEGSNLCFKCHAV